MSVTSYEPAPAKPGAQPRQSIAIRCCKLRRFTVFSPERVKFSRTRVVSRRSERRQRNGRAHASIARVARAATQVPEQKQWLVRDATRVPSLLASTPMNRKADCIAQIAFGALASKMRTPLAG